MNISEISHGVVGITKSKLNIDLADEKIIKKRLSICENCDSSYVKYSTLFGGDVRWCKECKCLIKHKTRLKDEICKKGLWPE